MTDDGTTPAPPQLAEGAAARRRRRGRRGFTLIEVLAAILLISIVVPVAMTATSQVMKSADAARRRTEAAGLADSKLAELIATGDWQTGALSGDFGEDHPTFVWTADAANWTEASMTELSVTVQWGGQNDPAASLSVSTLVYPVGTATDTGTTGTPGTGGTP